MIQFRYNIELPLDSPERTLFHKELIKRKKFLRKLYESWYAEFLIELKNLPGEKYVELGSGGGFLKELEPKVICTDILDLPENDMTFSALEMPFDDHSVDGIFMIDTLHHIPDMDKFLSEVDRVLTKGGQMIMIEPANTLWGRFIYRNFHHEPFDVNGDWTIPQKGPLSGANGALPWIVFERDRALFDQKFPGLQVERISFRNPLIYLVSGGVSFRQLLPDFMFGIVRIVDGWLPRIWKQISMFQLIRVVKV